MTHLPHPDHQPEFYDGVPLKRLIAWLVDTAVIAALSLIGLIFTAFTAIFFFALFYLIVGFVYRTATIAAGSATWGMRLAGIELRDAGGRPLDGGLALAHTLGYSVSIAFPVLQAISVLMMLLGARGQGLTDAVLGTVMLNRAARG